MLTNTATIDLPDHSGEITATTIAIDDAERRHQAALRDITRLADSDQISADEAAGLEAETIARFVAHAHELELRGAEIVDADVLAPSPRSGVALVVACVLKTLGPLGEDPERARESAKIPAARHTPPQNSESCTTSGSVGAGSGSLPSLKRLGHVTPSRLTSWASRRRSSFGA